MEQIPLGITFDDVLLIPQKSDITPSEVDLRTPVTRHISIASPLLSAAMDTVTESNMALTLAQEGALGILHRNCTIEQQVKMAAQVKKQGKHLLVGAAIGPFDLTRAKALDQAHVDVISIDCAHAYKSSIIKSVQQIKKSIQADLIVGNIGTAEAAKAFLPYADALKVGMGPGAICTTRIVSGVGIPQLTALFDVAKIAKTKNVPVIADGGIRFSGDIVKALAAGAHTVMLGSMFAGCYETPGKIVTIQGKKFKAYRGMGSLAAMKVGKVADRYAQKGSTKHIPEGVEAYTSYKGSVHDVLFQMIGGIKSGMGYIGAKNIDQLHKKAKFMRITQASITESHPHSIIIDKKAPNY